MKVMPLVEFSHDLNKFIKLKIQKEKKLKKCIWSSFGII